ncbi:MAG: tRNA lysidine(34) synthetase TilS [Planctomycetota bacterium]
MAPSASVRSPSGGDETARTIVAEWRRLTGGSAVRDPERRTIVACSGGADSSALVLALSGMRPSPVVAHVIHDLRVGGDSIPDRDAAQDLADALGLEFHSVSVSIAGTPGNREDAARRAREDVLRSLSHELGISYVATGHHADDQLETLLLRLVRGSAPSGLAGIRQIRWIDEGNAFVRPMLAVTHQDAIDLCRRCGWRWREDRTNLDSSNARARLRRDVMPALTRQFPRAAHSAVRTAAACAEFAKLAEARSDLVFKGATPTERGVRFDRRVLGLESAVVIGEILRRAIRRMADGEGLDRVTFGDVKRVSALIRSEFGESRETRCGPLEIRISRDHVSIAMP